MILIDATDLVLGRVASRIAKSLLDGEDVVVVNADRAVISGRKKSTLSEYDAWTEVISLVDPTQGPFHPRNPEDLLRRSVKGMLPMKKAKGRRAFDRLEVHSGVPAGFEGEDMKSFSKASVDQLNTRRFIRLGELSKHLKGSA